MKKAKTTKTKQIHIPQPQVPPKRQKTLPIPQEELEMLEKRKNENLIFSFKFLELDHKAFNLGGTCVRWVNDLFRLFKELSQITRDDLVIGLKDHYRSHLHNWEKLDYKYDLPDEFLKQVECRQVRISSSKGGIHGFIIGNTFYVVWLDPHHNLYPDERYGGRKIFEPPETCCGYRDEELKRLKEELEKCKKELKEYEALLDEKTRPA